MDAIDAVLMIVKRCVSSHHAQASCRELDVVTGAYHRINLLTALMEVCVLVCVRLARTHQPVCTDVADCMTHTHCGITQLHLALCSAIEDAVAVLAMHAEGADIIDVSVHRPLPASIREEPPVGPNDIHGADHAAKTSNDSSSVSSVDFSDSESDGLMNEDPDEKGYMDSDDSHRTPRTSTTSTLGAEELRKLGSASRQYGNSSVGGSISIDETVKWGHDRDSTSAHTGQPAEVSRSLIVEKERIRDEFPSPEDSISSHTGAYQPHRSPMTPSNSSGESASVTAVANGTALPPQVPRKQTGTLPFN